MSKSENNNEFKMQEDSNKQIFEDYKPDRMKNSTKIIATVLILLIVFSGAMVAGVFIGANEGIGKDMPLMIEAYELIKKYYYKDISWKEFQELATASMAGSIDQFTGLAIKSTSSSATGIGISLKSNVFNEHRVSFIYPNAPVSKSRTMSKYEYDSATKAYTKEIKLESEVAIEVGDRIYSAGYKDDSQGLVRVENATSANLKNILSNANYDTVTLRIIKESSASHMYEYEFDVKKDEYVSKLAYYFPESEVGDGVAMIKLIEFDTAACDDFDNCVQQFYADPGKPKKLILDLRDNGGGDSAVLGFIANYLLKNDTKEPQKIARYYYNKGNGKFAETYFTTRYSKPQEGNESTSAYLSKYIGNKIEGFECTVLCNSNTASSSEVLIGAMQHYNGAQIVGNKTYGKGVAQTVRNIGGGKYQLLITNGWYYIPTLNENGETVWTENIHEIGFTPSADNIILNSDPTKIASDSYIARAKAIMLK